MSVMPIAGTALAQRMMDAGWLIHTLKQLEMLGDFYRSHGETQIALDIYDGLLKLTAAGDAIIKKALE